MSRSENEGKGFGGLSSLSGRKYTSVQATAQVASNEIEETTPPANTSSEASLPESQTAAPSWRAPVILAGLCVAGFAFFAVFLDPSASQHENRPDPRSAYDAALTAPDAAADDTYSASSDDIAAAVAAAYTATDTGTHSSDGYGNWDTDSIIETNTIDEQPPSFGMNQILDSTQIRYCVHEKIRIDAAEKIVDPYVTAAVNRFNEMVTDYNGRCGSFQYRAGALELIQREAGSIRNQLEVQGRDRFSVRERIGNPATQQDATYDPVAVVDLSKDRVAADSANALNLSLCLSGDYPALCRHELLTPEDAQRVEQIELTTNSQICAADNSPSLCKHRKLTTDQVDAAEQTALRENYKK